MSYPRQNNGPDNSPVSFFRQWVIPAAAVLLVCGFAAGRYFGNRTAPPLFVSATASSQAFGTVLATGSYDNNTEILYYLDSQAGQLTAGLLSRGDPGFAKTYKRNIKADLAQAAGSLGNVSIPANPTFVMVTGDGDARRVGGGDANHPAKAFVYVAEVNTGIVLVYVIPVEGDRDLEIEWGDMVLWTSARLNVGSPIRQPSRAASQQTDRAPVPEPEISYPSTR